MMLRLQQEQQRASMECQRSASIYSHNQELQNELLIMSNKLAGEFHHSWIQSNLWRGFLLQKIDRSVKQVKAHAIFCFERTCSLTQRHLFVLFRHLIICSHLFLSPLMFMAHRSNGMWMCIRFPSCWIIAHGTQADKFGLEMQNWKHPSQVAPVSLFHLLKHH